tara:strand:+ start:693 stop:1385 length:693 start_codon:yes stop_codon:yes gene_type:complete
MALNTRDIIVFDFETGSRNPLKTQPTQIAAVVIHGKSLKLKEGGIFNSEMKPILDDEEAIAAGLDPVEDEALDITRKTRKALAKAPTPKYVWRKFGKFCAMHNWKGTSWFNPIAAGYNINHFDLPIAERMCQMYGPVDKKSGRQDIFHKIYKIDLMDTVYMWMESNPSVHSISMDSMRDMLGMSKENAHDALQDVKDTANILIKFMKLHRELSPKVKFEKAFANKNDLYI